MKELIKITKYSIFIGIFIFIIERTLSTNGFQVGFEQLSTIFLIDFIYAFVLNLLNFKYFRFLDKFISWKEQPKKRLIYGSIGAILVTMLGITVLRYLVVIIFEHGDFQDFLNTGKSYYIFSFIISINILITVHAIFFFKEISKKKVTEHQVISKTETAKFESLKNQLDPHFLFNSLNVLTSLIEENPKQAEKFTTKLSKVYRYVLQQKNQDLIEVNQELIFAKTYMDLLKLRFEDSIDFSITEDLDETLKIVPLSLQLLLENAVKHNEISPNKRLTIRIYKEDNFLVVENNLSPKNNLEKSTKVGLNNIKERYALVTPSKVIIENNKKTFKVKLPLLTKKLNIMSTSYSKEEKYYRAKKQVQKIRDFYTTLFMYILFIPFIFYIWYTYSSNTIQWFWFPILGWGIGLIFQGAEAFNKFPVLGSNWQKRKIRELMEDEEQINF
jgi:sensor histidine kinase YesM